MTRRAFLVLGAVFIANGCWRPNPKATRVELGAKPVGAPITVTPPLGLPPVPVPADRPLTKEVVALGEKLYFSPLLSVDRTVSCATCHDPSKGFTDRQPVSTGVKGKKGNRNAPTVINAAYAAPLFWDGRAATLEAQAAGPIVNPVEMAHSVEGVEKAVDSDPALRAMFVAAYGDPPPGQSPVTMERITAAIAAFERTVLRGNSPFDRYQYGGDRKALSPAAIRGLAIFRDAKKGNCAVCHTIEEKYALFTDNKFHNLGVGMNTEGELTDLGRFLVTNQDTDTGAFRTPSLRNVAETAPYMHDGSLKTLKDVVDFYVGGGNANKHLDKEIKPLTHLTQQERADLVAFLESLTGEATP
ncbi:MAG: c-type cytochrome [Bryobacteraceae bacterium]|nr:c-type cytochrome [Bryobacteraceae bacterium]MDW8377774.1 cytochrome c peroxidase [Bryobacterales bacterium]